MVDERSGRGGKRKGVIVDDLIDTAGTLVEGAGALFKRGAKEVYACATPSGV